MTTPAEQVSAAFAQANNYAQNALTQLESYTAAMRDAVYAQPTYNVDWVSIAAPTAITYDAPPSALTSISNDFKFDSSVLASKPADLSDSLTAPSFDIAGFTGTVPTLNLPAAPTLNYGTAPTVPSLSAVTVPDAPTVTMPSAPTLLSLSTIAFGGVDLRESMLTRLEDVPTLTLAGPTPYTYAAGPTYASDLLTALKATLQGRLAGGTGLAPAVEQAMWDRLRSREERLADANQQEVMRNSQAFGFALPSGTLAAQLREAQQAYYDKLSEVSREITIKQAELEQENLRQTIDAGIKLEAELIDYAWKIEQIAFDSAKEYAKSAIDLHNAAVQRYQALLAGYEAYEKAYKTIIDAQSMKVEVYKAQLDAEKTKAQINVALVDQYKTQVEAGMAVVELYKAQLGGTQALIALEGAKISAAGEQIRAYTASVNAETSKVEAYKAGVEAERTKIDTFKVQVDAYASYVSAQGEKARANVAYYNARVQGYSEAWRGYSARVDAERARVQAIAQQSSAMLEGYRANLARTQAQVDQDIKRWETAIGQYSRQKEYTLTVAKMNNDAVLAQRQSLLEVGKVGTQVYAQLTASAMGRINAQAQIQASSDNRVSYSYSGSTTSSVAPVTAA
ncbi:hypothetical protein PSQ40_04965 [Curvibacter sp. HBC61]|uniref:Outer membrane efflux protein n=1 Tax=Curvibacter cyanobacteriorum TaxID=3026422 RepID=A0ABT5MVP7_9BURK|nr:hypothetical protein [Curvibacter sp. HBC61]MDD0837917.1 hypothetical protein [Curvibacter sp. HBC61]